jgi:hypothetical protein
MAKNEEAQMLIEEFSLNKDSLQAIFEDMFGVKSFLNA